MYLKRIILTAIVLGCLTFAGCGTGQQTRTITIDKASTPTRHATKIVHRAKVMHHKPNRQTAERTQEAYKPETNMPPPGQTARHEIKAAPHANPESSYSQAIHECNDNGSEAEGTCNREWQENHTGSEDGIPPGTPGCHETTWNGMKVTEC